MMRQAALTVLTPSGPSSTSRSGTLPTPSQIQLDREVRQMEAWCEGMMDQGRWDGEVWMSDEDTRKVVAASVKKARKEEEEEDEDPRNIYKPSRSGRSHGKLIAIDDEHEDPGFFDTPVGSS